MIFNLISSKWIGNKIKVSDLQRFSKIYIKVSLHLASVGSSLTNSIATCGTHFDQSESYETSGWHSRPLPLDESSSEPQPEHDLHSTSRVAWRECSVAEMTLNPACVPNALARIRSDSIGERRQGEPVPRQLSERSAGDDDSGH